MATKPYVDFVGFFSATESLSVFHHQVGRFVAIYIDVEAYRHIFKNVGIEAAEVFVTQAMQKIEMNCSQVRDVVRITEHQILVMLGLPRFYGMEFLTGLVDKVVRHFNYHDFLPIHSHAVVDSSDLKKLSPTELLTDLYREVSPMSGKADFDSKYDLKKALQSNDITSFFQPVFRTNGELRGFEVLARWVLGEHVIGPDKFLGELNRKALGKELIVQHLLRADKLLDNIHLSFGCSDKLIVSINIEPKLLSDITFVEELCCLPLHNDPSHFEFEMVESGNLELVHGRSCSIKKLTEKGFRLAIDDFGVGYAISNTLSSEISTVKIDRKLVHSACSGQSLSQNIIKGLVASFHSVTHQLGEVIAEGIETQSMKEFVASLGVDALQGFLFAKPMDFEELMTWLVSELGYKHRNYSNVVSIHEKQS
ncbi:TPA: EAL domain-containing protein [Vibrio cholerae]|nr:EAL domain-containing protein [Vibrio cholerae]HCT5077633.1 EAL domain-containing protein [Vibrio cholerae]HEJ2447597.1 EAL domain-containing protein [Vibrio cholerae]